MDSAAARKERLKALKAQAEATPAGADGQPVVEPQLKFRNYQPTSKKIEHEVLAPAAPPVYQEPAPAPEETAANGQVSDDEFSFAFSSLLFMSQYNE